MVKLRSELRKAERIARASKRKRHWRRFQATRLAFRRTLRRSRAEFYKNKIQECGTDSRALWCLLDQLVGRHRVKESPPLEASLKRAEAFNEFFSSKIRILRETVDAEALRLLAPPDDPNVLSPRAPDQLQFFPPVSSAEVIRLILQSPTKSCRLDPLPCSLLKRTVHIIGPAIAEIVNMSLSTGVKE